MNTLSKLVNKAVQKGFLDGFYISKSCSDGLLISDLLCADDNLIFSKSNKSNLGYLGCILLLFEAISDLRVNLSKIALIPICEALHVETLSPFLWLCS